jgi:DNA-binding transcriptional MerR regulator
MENELRTNAKYFGPEEQFQIRKSILRLHKQGLKTREIKKAHDVSERHVEATVKKYK